MFQVIAKDDPSNVVTIEAPSHFFITHNFGAFEEGNVIHLDVIAYDNAEIYTNFTFVEQALYG